MPRIKKRHRTPAYTEAERHQLLCGMTLHPTATRFGHPFRSPPLRLAAIRTAWASLRAELLTEWASERYDHYRERNPLPYAERLEQEQ